MPADDRFKRDLYRPIEGAYVNTAAESPLLTPVAEALLAYAREKGLGEPGRSAFEAAAEGARRRAAALLRADPSGIAFAYSASDALGLLIHSLPWEPGDRAVVSAIEYPSDLLVWRSLAGARVAVDLVTEGPFDWGTEAILRRIGPRTRLVVASAVSYSTGRRIDLKRIKDAVNAQGGWLLADATQALGAVPLFADEADMIVASGFKWMMGVHGVALLYCDPQLANQFEPPFAGWRSVAGSGRDARRAPLKEGALRFEMGMPGFPALFALEAGLAYLQDRVGLEETWRRVEHLAGHLRSALAQMGLPVITREDPAERAGIVCLHDPRARQVVAALKEAGVYAYAPVDDVIRFSPHFFNCDEDIDRCIFAMRHVIRSRSE